MPVRFPLPNGHAPHVQLAPLQGIDSLRAEGLQTTSEGRHLHRLLPPMSMSSPAPTTTSRSRSPFRTWRPKCGKFWIARPEPIGGPVWLARPRPARVRWRQPRAGRLVRTQRHMLTTDAVENLRTRIGRDRDLGHGVQQAFKKGLRRHDIAQAAGQDPHHVEGDRRIAPQYALEIAALQRQQPAVLEGDDGG